MTFDDVKLLESQQVKGIYNDVYNGFWRRYSGAVPEPESREWERITAAAEHLINKYGGCPLVVHQIQDLMDQLEVRSRRKKREEEAGIEE